MTFKKLLPVIVLSLCWLSSNSVQAQQAVSQSLENVLPIRIATQVTSEDYFAVKAIVDQSVLDTAGNELIKAGTEVILQVIKEKARHSGRPGKVIIEPLRVPTSDGRLALLQGSATFVGEDRHDMVVLAAVGGCLFFGPPGLLLLLIEGKPAYVPPGYLLTNVVIKSVE